jgi:hypothetical protein
MGAWRKHATADDDKEVWGKTAHGHILTVAYLHGGGIGWQKYIDGHFRGSTHTLELAQEQLEREAAGEGSAWETQK